MLPLHKPTWNPPSWVFGPAWTLLYILMATAAWIVWREGGWKVQGRALGLFLLQWLLNALWTPLFFGMHQTGLAFAEIILLWLMIALTLKAFWVVKRLRRVAHDPLPCLGHLRRRAEFHHLAHESLKPPSVEQVGFHPIALVPGIASCERV